MRIVSQSKWNDVPYELNNITLVGKEIIGGSIDKHATLGMYATEERALEVMEEIRTHYMRYLYMYSRLSSIATDWELAEYSYFYMPKE